MYTLYLLYIFVSPFVQGYTNVDNPFGDEHLLDTFHWNKKLEKAGIKGAPKEQIEKLQKQKMIENKVFNIIFNTCIMNTFHRAHYNEMQCAIKRNK